MLQRIDKGFYRNMMRLALPIALQNILSSCAAVIDTGMVVGLGNVVTAGVGIANRWNFLLTLVLFGFCSGSSVLIAQYWGAKQEREIHKTFGIAIAGAWCLALVYVLVASFFAPQLIGLYNTEPAVIAAGSSYLRIVCFTTLFQVYSMMSMGARRSTEDVKTPMIATGLGVVCNTFLNYVLIYGNLGAPALGVRGAAYATVIAAIVQALAFLVLGAVQRHFTFASPRKLFRFERAFVRHYFKIAAPVLCNETLWAVGFNIYAIIFARQGNENYAAYTMFSTIQDLAFVFFVGVCNACAIMIGKTVGAGGLGEAYNMGKRFVRLTPLLGLVIGGVLVLVRNPILGVMNIETELARQLCSQMLLFYGLWLPIRMIPYTCVVGVFRAGGDTKTGFFIDVGTMFLWSIPIVALLAYLEVPFLWLVMGMYISEDVLKACVCLWHFRSRRWIRRLTRSGEYPQPLQESTKQQE